MTPAEITRLLEFVTTGLPKEYAASELMQRDFRLVGNVIAAQNQMIDELKADAEKWRAYKARKDAVLAAGMGRNPLRSDE